MMSPSSGSVSRDTASSTPLMTLRMRGNKKSRAGSRIDRMMPTQEASGKADKRITGKMD